MDATILAALISIVIGSIFTFINQSQIETLKAALSRREKLEESRRAGYKDIWEITGTLNLYGTTTAPNIIKTSTRLKNWYFEHGMVLSHDSKEIYFLVQQILHFGILKSASFDRPSDDWLYGNDKPTPKVLSEFRKAYLDPPANDPQIEKIENLENTVSNWKKNWHQALQNNENQAEINWILLQLHLSRFRSSLIKDLGFDNNASPFNNWLASLKSRLKNLLEL